jgi:hypothetical protein
VGTNRLYAITVPPFIGCPFRAVKFNSTDYKVYSKGRGFFPSDVCVVKAKDMNGKKFTLFLLVGFMLAEPIGG